MQEIIYKSESRLRNPRQLFKEMIHDLGNSRGLAYRLLLRNIRSHYRQSFLGVFWAFIPSLVTAGIFIMARNSNVFRIGVTDLPYPLYVVFSMTVWQTFVESLNAPIQAIMSEKALIGRQKVSPEPIILARLGEVIFNFSVRSIIVVGFFVYFQVGVASTILLVPFVFLMLILFGACIGLILSPLNALYHDISKGLAVATTFWLFLTPVVYPQPREGLFSFFVQLNPVTPFIVTIRELTVGLPLTQLPGLFVVALLSMIGIFAAWIVFRISLPHVLERMN